MKATKAAIAAAYQHHKQHIAGGRAWDVGHHLGLISDAEKAFGDGRFSDFETVYEALSSHWQVFRKAKSHWPARKTFKMLRGLEQAYRSRRLSALTDADILPLWTLLSSLKSIKVLASGRDSVVAVSKFLHFWNPGLFVIVDQGVVWDQVFDRWWVWDSLAAVRSRIDGVIGAGPEHDDSACDLATYLAVLFWAAELVSTHSDLIPEFVRYVSEFENPPVQPARLEALAVEWFLLGVVQIPPAGISVE